MIRLADRHWGWPVLLLALVAPFSVGIGNAAVGLVLAAAVLRLAAGDGRAHLPPRAVVWALLAYLAVHAAATLLSGPNPQRWDKWFEEMWLKLLLLAVPILGGGSPRQLERAARIAVLAGGAVGIYAVVQHFAGVEFWRGKPLEPIGGTYFALGFFSHHLSYGGQALVLWTLAAAWALERGLSRRRPVSWPLLAFLLLSLGLLWSFARSAQVGAVAGAAALLLLQRGWKRRWGLAALGGVLAVAAALPSVRMRFAGFLQPGAEETRLNLWRSSLDGIAARPLLGWGPGNFGRLLDAHAVEGFYDSRAHSHNDFLMHACNAGLLGLAAALALLVLVTVLLWRGRSGTAVGGWILAGGAAAQVALAVAGLFQVYQTDDEVEMALYLLLGCGLGLLSAARRGRAAGPGSPAP
jgi:O-antigen ligase